MRGGRPLPELKKHNIYIYFWRPKKMYKLPERKHLFLKEVFPYLVLSIRLGFWLWLDQETLIVVLHVPPAVHELHLKAFECLFFIIWSLSFPQFNQGILLTLQGNEVALGRRQPTNLLLSQTKINWHLIKCVTTTDVTTMSPPPPPQLDCPHELQDVFSYDFALAEGGLQSGWLLWTLAASWAGWCGSPGAPTALQRWGPRQPSPPRGGRPGCGDGNVASGSNPGKDVAKEFNSRPKPLQEWGCPRKGSCDTPCHGRSRWRKSSQLWALLLTSRSSWKLNCICQNRVFQYLSKHINLDYFPCF